MESINNFLRSSFNKIYQDRLISNSLYLMMNTLVLSAAGFIFWMINTKFHTPQEIGLATTFISTTTLINSFSLLGLNLAIVRFLPKATKKNELINTVFTLILSVSFIFACIFILGIRFFSPELEALLNNKVFILLFLIFIPLASINMITDSVFISYGKAVYTLIVNTLMSISKVALTILLVSFGAIGIISSFGLAVVIATIASVLYMIFKLQYIFGIKLHPDQIKTMWRFSFGNYISGILGSITALLTPLLITSKLTPEITAYYYMPTMIVNLLLAIPKSTVYSLIAEGAREEVPLLKLTLKSLANIYGILIPACLAIFILGNFILSAFGKNYSSEGLLYLNLLIVSVLISIPGFISGAVLNVKKKIRQQLIINFISATLSMGLNILLLPRGLFGLGISAIIFQIMITFIYIFVLIQQENTEYLKRRLRSVFSK